MLYTVLAADDEQELLEVLELYLAKDDIHMIKAGNGNDALALFRSQPVHLVLLDIMMPGLDGYSVLREIRKESNIPAIMLSAKDSDNDKILGLELGADDYITKPFSLMILRARVNARLRSGAAPLQEELQIGGLTLCFDKMQFSKDGIPVELSKTEQRLLRVLIENRGHTLARAALVDAVWTDGSEYVDENALSVTIKRLRDKLESNASSPEYIKTVYGIGYMWVVK